MRVSKPCQRHHCATQQHKHGPFSKKRIAGKKTLLGTFGACVLHDKNPGNQYRLGLKVGGETLSTMVANILRLRAKQFGEILWEK